MDENCPWDLSDVPRDSFGQKVGGLRKLARSLGASDSDALKRISFWVRKVPKKDAAQSREKLFELLISIWMAGCLLTFFGETFNIEFIEAKYNFEMKNHGCTTASGNVKFSLPKRL